MTSIYGKYVKTAVTVAKRLGPGIPDSFSHIQPLGYGEIAIAIQKFKDLRQAICAPKPLI